MPMKPIKADDPEAKSADIVADNIARLKELFPEALTEGKIDFEVLKQLLDGLNWNGKRQARQLALTPSLGTLRPCPEESVDWDTTKNIFIEGDNLEVLKLLQKSYAGRVKLIYIDPPYNTGKDFVYKDDFQDNIKNYQMLIGARDSDGRKIEANTEASGRFHTDWLNMIYPRLKIARSLLCEDGAIFISIDDGELSNLLTCCDEIFGSENLVATFIWEKRTNRENRKTVSSRHDYVVCLCKNSERIQDTIKQLPMSGDAIARYKNPDNDYRGPWKSDPATAQAGHGTKNQFYTLTAPNGRRHELSSGRCWLFTQSVMDEAIHDKRIWFGQDGNGVPRIKTYLDSKERGLTPESIWPASAASTNEGAKNELKRIFDGEAVFETPKPTKLIRQILNIAGRSGIIMDFFAGSGTTAQAVYAENSFDAGNRRFILVQLPEGIDEKDSDQAVALRFCKKLKRPATVAELTKERIFRVARTLKHENPLLYGDLGFRVFKLDSSNIRTWSADAKNLTEQLELHATHLSDDRTEQDILYEVLLKLGLDLCVPIESRTIAGKEVSSVGGGVLMTCLVPEIGKKDLEKLGHGIVEWWKEQAPEAETQVVFRDSAFPDDVAKTNMAKILEQAGIKTVRSL